MAMSIIKKVCGLGLVGLALALSVPAEARLAANKLATNKLATNSAAGNAGDGAFTNVAAVDLPNGMRFTR